ncbi:hypothetical protein A2Z22_04565 [Candidatus Woesebacteria bacterium RBG_16_34_12]|uniref:DNA polymerase III delta subunit-like C-terminal domain-containing protein n=1 Tax=Candidatus Woesebacteria bacterium RBG_16_34_12 TaxID=1802480 RepID=A0A1F7XDC2_9BACT|nr:MAG: hypothetical protein A2Z22_04565 [Candidatus Woesebacteria bacterium RBG_16_34_12]
MKTIILHGDYTEKSYQRLQTFIKVAKKRNLEIKKVNLNTKFSLSEQLSSTELFKTENLYILENISKIPKKEIVWLKKNNNRIEGTLIIYNSGILSKTLIKQFPKPDKIEEYKLPKIIWNFLESFYQGNAKNCIKLLHQVIDNDPIELVFVLLVRQLKDLYLVSISDSKSSSIQNKSPFPYWREAKLKKQAQQFKKDQIKEIISELAEIDLKVKTSRGNLIDSLDFLIATKLE